MTPAEMKYFEDFKIGDVYQSQSRAISQELIERFSQISGDANPIHMDREFAQKTIYGKRIAHGLLVLSIVSGLAVGLGLTDQTTLAFASLAWKFKRPVFIGDELRVKFEVLKKHLVAGTEGGMIVFQVSAFNQEEVLVQNGKWSLVIMRRKQDRAAETS